MKPKITVIIPTLNTAKYITECLESVLGQSIREIEVLVIDADSTDGTAEIIKEFEKNDNRVHLYRDDKRSTGYAKNLGIDMASAPYVAIVEPDDYLDKYALENLYKNIEETRADIAKGGFDSFIGNQENRMFFPKSVTDNAEDYGKVTTPRNNYSAFRWSMFEWLCLYRKEFLVKHNIRHNETPGAAFQDIGFCFLTLSYADKVVLINNVIYHYRCDNPNSSVKDSRKVFNTCNEYKYVRSVLEDHNDIWNNVKFPYCREFFHSNYVAYLRLSDELKPILSNEMHNIILEFIHKGFLDKDLFDSEEKKLLEQVILSSELFDKTMKECIDSMKPSLIELLEKVSDYEKVVIYGAGFFGANLQYILQKFDKNIVAFIDGDSQKQGSFLNGKMIMSPELSTAEYTDALYLVANKHNSSQIKEKLITIYKISPDRVCIVKVDELAINLI